ncbi:MAG: competence/damage-inducible protein A [Halothiobacillaceae bacterium]
MTTASGTIPTFGAIVIGDEILSGRRQDRHVPAVIERLNARGLRLGWAMIIGDDPLQITATLERSMQAEDIVFCFGGIGATPDDLTRECAAAAAGVPLTRHPDAVAEIEARFGEQAWPHRVLMADLPEGAELIPNDFNRVPGFSIRQHFFMPGFPQMAHPMLDWVLSGPLRALTDPDHIELALLVHDASESDLLELMRRTTEKWPALKLFSLPIIREQGRLLELGLKGPRGLAQPAFEELEHTLVGLGLNCHRLDQSEQESAHG